MTKHIFTNASPDALVLKEVVKAEVFRPLPGGGYPEEPSDVLCVGDLIVATGRAYLAQRIRSGDTVASAMNYMVVGTVTTAATLTDTLVTGEVLRKVLSYGSASNNVFSAVATFGGAADSLTGIALTEAGITNHAGSGMGTLYQRVTFSAWTPAASDLLKLTLQTNVGSS